MTKQQILELYGQSVYQIRLSLAIHYWLAKAEPSEEAFKLADNFLAALQAEDFESLKAKFH